MNILAVKFKYLGDVAIAVPALRALREHFPKAILHVLVAEGASSILNHISWINHVWVLPKKNLKKSLSTLWKLRQKKFDLSVDFVGNDRGALTSLLIGAKKRLGPIVPKGFIGRKYCYTHRIPEAEQHLHESLRDVLLLSKLDIPKPSNLEPELYSDPALAPYAAKNLSENAILCHLSTTRPKKEWPLAQWVNLFNQFPTYHSRFVFTTGPSSREQALLNNLLEKIPSAHRIQNIPSLAHFMALIDRAAGMICSDSLPAHLAAGLGTPAVVFFGPTTVSQWDPHGPTRVLKATDCICLGSSHTCFNKTHCLSGITPQTVMSTLENLLHEKTAH